MKEKMERFLRLYQIRYAGRLAGIMLITSLFSFLLHGLGIGKENILMLFIVGVLLVAYCTEWIPVWRNRFHCQRYGIQLPVYGTGAYVFHIQSG